MFFALHAEKCCGWAMAVLGWTPDAAWAATPYDFYAAHKAYLRWHGLDAHAAPCSTAQFTKLKELFPDDGYNS
jgi:Phage tail assembly chaperone protein, TAC